LVIFSGFPDSVYRRSHVNALYCSEEAPIVIFLFMLILSGRSAISLLVKGFAYLIVQNVTSLLYISKSVRIELWNCVL